MRVSGWVGFVVVVVWGGRGEDGAAGRVVRAAHGLGGLQICFCGRWPGRAGQSGTNLGVVHQ
jgi:hypothetical protein